MEDFFEFRTVSGEVVFSNKTEHQNDQKKQTKGKSRSSAKDIKTITYPIFRDMKEFCKNDNFWQKKLTTWSEGKVSGKYKFFPENNVFRFSKNNTSKPKKHEIILDPNDLKGSLEKIKKFVSEHTAEASEFDILQCRILENQNHNEVSKVVNRNVFNKAEDLKKIILNYIHINYASSPLGHDNITANQHNSLMDSITLAILSKNISPTFITDKKNKKIPGIDLDKNGLFCCNVDKMKQFKIKNKIILERNDSCIGDDDEDDGINSRNGEEYCLNMKSFVAFIEKYQKTFY